MRVLVTGGAGFIGSAVCRHLAANPEHFVVNLDKLTYAGNLTSLKGIEGNDNYVFAKGDISNTELVANLLQTHRIDTIMHLAAESHVDRSIHGPDAFIDTNIVGTYELLQTARAYWDRLPAPQKDRFRFHHISTDEVFGDLDFDNSLFSETSPYKPSSPYSASKAASDHLVRAWHHTYGLPVVLSNCSNNYGPFHYPEKLIPLAILNALDEQPIPIYGNGNNVRDWLYVEDHAQALQLIASKGKTGHSYNVGGHAERHNIDVVRLICTHLDTIRPRKNGQSHTQLITCVDDRKGHDRRYAIDATKIETELGWKASHDFETGLAKTIDWYVNNRWWWEPLRTVAPDH